MPPIHVLIKPASAGCNMRCRYCFYADEAACRQEGMWGIMSRETARAAIRRALAHAEGSCTFMFQGGEPPLAGLDFFRFFADTVRQENRRGVQISYAFQTNGLALDAQWAEFLAQNQVLVGISMDGTAQVHDALRPAADGSGTHSTVMENLQMLRRAGVECNVLAVMTRQLARSINQTYDFFPSRAYSTSSTSPVWTRWRRPGADANILFPRRRTPSFFTGCSAAGRRIWTAENMCRFAISITGSPF